MSDERPSRELQLAIAVAQGRLASGDPAALVFEDVRVTCHKCHGVTVFPVLLDRPRRVGTCAHCGVEV